MQNELDTATTAISKKIANILIGNLSENNNELNVKYRFCFQVFDGGKPIDNPDTLESLHLLLYQLLEIEKTTMVYSLILLVDFLNNTDLLLTPSNTILLVLTSMSVAMKYLEDIIITNQELAKRCGLEKNQMIEMEGIFLKGLEYKVYRNLETYEKYLSFLV